MIKKYKVSNFAAIMILLAADLGIGYFTLPYLFTVDVTWGNTTSSLHISNFAPIFELCRRPIFLLPLRKNLPNDEALVISH